MHVWVFAREVRRRKRVSRTRRKSFLLRNGFRADQCIVKMLGAPSKRVADKQILLTDRCSFTYGVYVACLGNVFVKQLAAIEMHRECSKPLD